MIMMADKVLEWLYVGIDISKKTFDICMMHADGRVSKTLQITSDRQGFAKLVKYLPASTDPVFCMENTGPLAGNLVFYLKERGYDCMLSNPFEVSRLRDAFSASVKNDVIDAFVLAQAARMGVLKHSSKEFEYIYLQDILERYFDLKDRRTALINQLHANLVQTFPEIGEVFSNIGCKAATAILLHYPTPTSLEGVESADLRELVRVAGGRITQKKLELLLQARTTSVAWKQTEVHGRILQSQVRELQILTQEIDMIQNLLDEYTSDKFPAEIQVLQSVPGISQITASQLLAVVGDHHRFDPKHDGRGSKRLSAFAGFGVREYSSGPRKLKSGISKRGNSRLRGLLFMAAFSAIKTDAGIAEIYEYKKERGGGKKATVSISHLLLRRCYGVLKTGKNYNPAIPMAG